MWKGKVITIDGKMRGNRPPMPKVKTDVPIGFIEMSNSQVQIGNSDPIMIVVIMINSCLTIDSTNQSRMTFIVLMGIDRFEDLIDVVTDAHRSDQLSDC